jgi:hypothetical protein
MYTNARYNFYSSGLFNYYVEARRWKDALEECKSRRIPNTLITPTEFLGNLQSISDNYATPNGYSLTIGGDNVSQYYRGGDDLVDCAFTEDSLIVVVNVPLSNVRRKSLKKVEILPVPTREDMDASLCYLKGLMSDKDLIVIEEYLSFNLSSTALRRVVVFPEDVECSGSGRLCRIKAASESKKSWPVRRRCAQAILEEDSNSDEVCGWSCFPSKSFQYPMIRRVASDRFLIVGDPLEKEINVECPLYQKMESFELPSSGIVELTLPCDCMLSNGDEEYRARKESCGSELIQHPIDYPFYAVKNVD